MNFNLDTTRKKIEITWKTQEEFKSIMSMLLTCDITEPATTMEYTTIKSEDLYRKV